MAEEVKIEKFAPSELATLRAVLMKSRTDSWQAAELVSCFLAGRGYGVNAKAIRNALPKLGLYGRSHETMQSVLETVAYMM